jgi:hypothetical protein
MPATGFDERRNAFEEEYFKTKDASVMAKLKQVFEAKISKDELRKTAGINDEAVLDRLVKLNINGNLLAAFKLLPLVEIAWADGSVDKEEARIVRDAAIKAGVPATGPAMERMEEWLHRGPSPDGRKAWYMFAEELRNTLTAAELDGFRTELLKYAKDVAQASGGVLGLFGQISPGEKRVLDEVTKALSK